MSDSTDWEVLFHYTSLMNFERIIRNGYIALCDIIKSNDPAEGYFAFDALKHAYRELYQEEVIDRNTYDKLHRVYIDFSEGEKLSDDSSMQYCHFHFVNQIFHWHCGDPMEITEKVFAFPFPRNN